MVGFLNSLENVVSTAPGTPLITLSLPANLLSSKLDEIKGNLEKLKSNTVKTV
jgi:hypothetical protein